MRLFVALDVGDAFRAEVARVCAIVQAALAAAPTPPRVAWVAPASLHLTVRFLGEVSEPESVRLQKALTEPVPVAPFRIEWRGLGAFPSPRQPRALWMGLVAGALEVGRVEAAISSRIDGGALPDVQPFHPHVTLGRVKAAGAGVDWVTALRAAGVIGVPSFVNHVGLYRSELSSRGPHYTELARADLRDETEGAL